MKPQDLSSLLDTLAELAGVAAEKLPGMGGLVAAIIATSTRFAADLARQGVDPIERIERIHAADSALASVEDSWAEALREKFSVVNPPSE